METLPLFPLGTVLVPEARLPLRIFEPRYVRLLRGLLDGTRAPEFGVVAIRVGQEVGSGGVRAVHSVGCVAVLEKVDRIDERSYRIRARGTQRFRLEGLAESGEPYLVGLVTRLPDDDGEPAEAAVLARLVRDRLTAYRARLGMAADAETATGLRGRSEDVRALSYRLGDLVALPLAERQQLLEAPTTLARLDLARRLLKREIGLVEELGAVPHVVDTHSITPN